VRLSKLPPPEHSWVSSASPDVFSMTLVELVHQRVTIGSAKHLFNHMSTSCTPQALNVEVHCISTPPSCIALVNEAIDSSWVKGCDAACMLKGRHYFFPWQVCKVLQSACLCVSVCFSACISRKPHIQISPYFLYMLPVAMARSSSNSNAVCVILPVLWMMPCLHLNEWMSQNRRRACFSQLAAPEAKSVVSDGILFWTWSAINSMVIS